LILKKEELECFKKNFLKRLKVRIKYTVYTNQKFIVLLKAKRIKNTNTVFKASIVLTQKAGIIVGAITFKTNV